MFAMCLAKLLGRAQLCHAVFPLDDHFLHLAFLVDVRVPLIVDGLQRIELLLRRCQLRRAVVVLLDCDFGLSHLSQQPLDVGLLGLMLLLFLFKEVVLPDVLVLQKPEILSDRVRSVLFDDHAVVVDLLAFLLVPCHGKLRRPSRRGRHRHVRPGNVRVGHVWPSILGVILVIALVAAVVLHCLHVAVQVGILVSDRHDRLLLAEERRLALKLSAECEPASRQSHEGGCSSHHPSFRCPLYLYTTGGLLR